MFYNSIPKTDASGNEILSDYHHDSETELLVYLF